MMTFFHDHGHGRIPPGPLSLRNRRRIRRARDGFAVVVIALACIAMAFMQTNRQTISIVVAADSLRAGSVLSRKDLESRSIPVGSALGSAFESALGRVFSRVDDAVGLVLLVDTAQGDVVSHSMASDAVQPPAHYATMDVPVVAAPQGNSVGRHAILATDTGCGEGTTDDDGLCTVSSDAIILDVPHESEGTTILSCAMPAADALRVTRMARDTPLVAVSSSD